jgi:hypothetical protein
MIVTETRGDRIGVFTPRPATQEIASIAQPGGPYGHRLRHDA